MFIYFDIETIPTQNKDVIEKISQGITAPGNYKKEDSIKEWETTKKPAAVDEAVRKTALNGTYGEIISIAVAIDDNPVECFIRTLRDSETEVIAPFMDVIMQAVKAHHHTPVFVGHYISGFDLRFVWQRCVINRVKPYALFPYNAKPWSDQVYDTKIEWTGMQNYTGDGSLDALCMAFGLEGKGDLDGSKVWDYVQAGRLVEVMNYNIDDVEKVRKIHKLMTFAA